MDVFAPEFSLNPLWRKRCVLGCGTEAPQCPECPKGQECSLIPMTCDECQKTICIPSRNGGGNASGSKGSSSNIGAIAGGAVAGIVVIAALVYCVWRFCIKPKRQQMGQDIWMDNSSVLSAEKPRSFNPDARMSTHTVGSVASSTMTRASNVIQIAYIPGVTNRGSTPSTPGLLVPPVPPIPSGLSSGATSPAFSDDHFFTPRDLRDSTFSVGTVGTQHGRNSVASTLYGKNAIVSPIPAQTALRGKAAVVSVHNKNGISDMMPPVPDVDYGRYGVPTPLSPAGESFPTTANAATVIKPSVVNLASLKKDDETSSIASATTLPIPTSSSRAQGSIVDRSTSPRLTEHTVSPMSSREPMSIPNLPELDTPRVGNIPELPELDAKRQSTKSTRIPDLPELDTATTSPSSTNSKTPFGDEHEIKPEQK